MEDMKIKVLFLRFCLDMHYLQNETLVDMVFNPLEVPSCLH
jgi:hypothetical protein